jgi:hypothetical protein
MLLKDLPESVIVEGLTMLGDQLIHEPYAQRSDGVAEDIDEPSLEAKEGEIVDVEVVVQAQRSPKGLNEGSLVGDLLERKHGPSGLGVAIVARHTNGILFPLRIFVRILP